MKTWLRYLRNIYLHGKWTACPHQHVRKQIVRQELRPANHSPRPGEVWILCTTCGAMVASYPEAWEDLKSTE
jgi:hypothetical protein